MKKFYLLFTMMLALLGFSSTFGQVYTATAAGNWNSGGTWDINGVPANPCSGCTITVNGNVAVTLNVSQTLTNGSVLNIGTDATTPAVLVIPTSSGTSISTGFNILLDGSSSNVSKVLIANKFSGVSAISTGDYDGIFIDQFFGTFDTKIIGNRNSGSHTSFFLGQPTPGNNPPPKQSTLPGPASLGSNSVLPIFLGSFDAVLDKKSVDLSWTSLVEVNADHYSIERSNDATNWRSIGVVAAVGNSSGKSSYTFVDPSPSSGANYYRLQMVDRDNKYKYSWVKVVRGSLIEGYSVFPNPTRDNINVTVSANASEELTFRLVNQNGQVMQERKFSHAAGTTVTMPVSNYPQGSYILTIVGNDGRKEVSKILIAR